MGIPDMIGPLGEKTKGLSNNIKSISTKHAMNEFAQAGQSLIGSILGLGGRGDKLEYPIDLSGNPAYASTVKFQVFEYTTNNPGTEQTSHIKQTDDNTLHANEFAGLGSSGGVAKVEGEMTDEQIEVEERGGGAATMVEEKKAKKDEDRKSVMELFDNATAGMSFHPKAGTPAVVMNFPQSMAYVDGVQYDNAQLMAAGATAMAVMEGGGSGMDAFTQAFGSEMKSVADVFKRGTVSQGQIDATRLSVARAAQYIPAILGGDTARSVIALNNRMIVNPNLRAVFRGVNLREFAFQFKLIPTSPEEARVAEKIIKLFRRELYPRTFPVEFGAATADLGYYFPNAFKISFRFRGIPNSHIPQIKHCYLRNFSHTINPTGGAFHSDGQPNEIDISMSFVEHETLKQHDIDEGF